MKIKELPQSERPYEKLEMYSANRLSNAELLAIVIKSGTKEHTSIELAQKILNLKQENGTNLRFLQDVSITELMQIKGIGRVKAIQLKAICELAKRMARPLREMQAVIHTPEDLANLLMEELRYEKREIVKVVILNTKNKILKIEDISLGGANHASLVPKDALSEAIKMCAPKIILVHNHPSGDPTPSKSDYHMTDRMYDAAELVGIQMLDHIIIGDGNYQSIFAKRKE